MKKVERITALIKNPLVSGSVIYTVAGLFNSLIPFLILPIISEYLTPDEYGVLSTFMVLVSIFSILVGVEQRGYISVNFFKKNKSELSKDIFGTFLISLFLSFLLLAIVLVFQDSFEDLIKIDAKWIYYALVIAFFQFANQMALTLWQLEEKPKSYGIFQIAMSSINYGMSLLLIIVFDMAEDGRIYGIATASVLFGLISYIILNKREYLKLNYSAKSIYGSLKFTIPLIPHGMAGWLNTGMDKVLINNFVGVAENGIYSLGYQFAMIIGLIASSFNRAFVPILYKRLELNSYEKNKVLVKYTYTYFLTLTVITFAAYIVTPYLIKWFISERYADANKYVFWIMMGFLADGFYYGVVNYIFYKKKTLYLSAITFITAILHFVLSFFLIPRLGAIAAAYSMAATYIVTFILVWIVSNRIHPMPWFSILNLKKNN
ncbi:MAG: oligosaccharide flippase family protein [Bacteroidota bacterium]